RTRGGLWSNLIRPERIWRSVAQMPAARTRTRASPLASERSGRSASLREFVSTTSAFMNHQNFQYRKNQMAAYTQTQSNPLWYHGFPASNLCISSSFGRQTRVSTCSGLGGSVASETIATHAIIMTCETNALYSQ